MTNPLDEQRAARYPLPAHVEPLRADIDLLRDMLANDNDAWRALCNVLEALTAPPLCAKGATRLGRHMTGRMIEGNFEADTITFQMDRGYYMAAGAYVIEPRDDWEARTTPAQPRREVTDADAKRAWKAYMDSSDPNGLGAMKAALESFANGGDGNG